MKNDLFNGPRLLRSKPRWRRAMLMTLALPPCLIGLFGLSIAYRIYAANRAMDDHAKFHLMEAPSFKQSLLVFAPHCDDETLGAAGLMHEARLHGCDVHVVIITNGDGFRVGVSQEYHKISVTSDDFRRYAVHRQGEVRTALAVLKVPADHIQFLGYPDRGLMPMWTTNWSPKMPFESPYTQADHCPYRNAPTPGAPYCGSALLHDIKQQMETDQPTDIYVTHPDDDHPDHAAASVFVKTALDQLRAEGKSWALKAHLHYYLVHRGDWPVPQGLYENAALPPPAQMADLDTHWEQFPLTHRDVQLKYTAIKRYKSQTELTGRFLFSFARKNELFGTLRETKQSVLPYVASGKMTLSGDAKAWMGIQPVLRDPVGDNVVRAWQLGGDITQVLACRDDSHLYVRVDLHGSIDPRMLYSVSLRPIGTRAEQSTPIHIAVQPGREGIVHLISAIPGAKFVWHSTMLEIALPLLTPGLTTLANDTLYLSASTRFANMEVDKTGYHAVSSVHPDLKLQTASR